MTPAIGVCRRFGLAALFAGLAGACAAQVPCTPGRAAALCEQVAAAEDHLARGEPGPALELFERAAGLGHAADIELGIVRSQLQAGDFRRALAFAAHTAGAHGSDAAGTALYAWLLGLSGQAAFGQRLLDRARVRLPDAASLADVGALLASGAAATSPAALAAPARLAPYAVGAAPPASARLRASGLLLDGGWRALVPSGGDLLAGRVWLRDGLGRTVPARLERSLGALGLALLRLDRPLVGGAPEDALSGAASDAFPGSPALAIAFAAAEPAAPAWPWLRAGFLGGPGADGLERRLGIELPPAALPGGRSTTCRDVSWASRSMHIAPAGCCRSRPSGRRSAG